MIDLGLYVTYIFFFLALGSAVVLPIVHALKHPKELGKSAIGVGILLLVFILSFVLAGSEVTPKYISMGIDEAGSKLIGAGLTMFYIVFVGALLGIVYSEINKALK